MTDSAYRKMSATCNHPLRRMKIKPHHQHWITCRWGDDGWEVTASILLPNGMFQWKEHTDSYDYADLWCLLEDLRLPAGRWYAVGWGAGNALLRAGIVEALERGDVMLPPSRGKKETAHLRPQLTLTGSRCDVDLLIGKNRIRFLDLDQMGIQLDQLQFQLGTLRLDDVTRVLSEYLRCCTQIGMPVHRTTAAQIGYSRYKSFHVANGQCYGTDPAVRALERRAWHNGRCECFRLGDIPGTTYSYDVHSCYAAICRDELLQLYQMEYWPDGMSVSAASEPGPHHLVADVILKTDAPDYPVRFQGTPIFPVGRFYTSLCYPELRHALDRGRVEQIVRASVYRVGPALRSYAEWYLDARAKWKQLYDGKYERTLKQVFTQSLGFMGRHSYDWTDWTDGPGYKWWLGVTCGPEHENGVTQAQRIDGRGRYLRTGGEPIEAMPVVHGTITSYARVRLLEAMEAAGRSNVLYVDTDGMLVTSDGAEMLLNTSGVIGADAGMWDERFAPGRARIHGQKNYRIGDNYVCAGGTQVMYSLMRGCDVLTTPTGRIDSDGRVHPFELDCEDIGGESPHWRNYLVGCGAETLGDI